MSTVFYNMSAQKNTASHRFSLRKAVLLFRERAGSRTPDTLIKSQVLYQLSYTPILFFYQFDSDFIYYKRCLLILARFSDILLSVHASMDICQSIENAFIINAQSRNRTSDTGIFSPLLYRLSYLGI